jgi:hypothetical protein
MSEKIRSGDNNININNPHDKGYKYLLSSEKVFLEQRQASDISNKRNSFIILPKQGGTKSDVEENFIT